MKLERLVNVEDFREAARHRLPRMVFDFVDGAAGDEVTARRNTQAWGAVELRPSALVDVRKRDLSATVIGETPWSLPLMLGPAGLTRVMHNEGELAVARASHELQIPYVITPWSSFTIEELAAVGSPGLLWLEVHAMADAELRTQLINRAADAGFGGLVYLVDTPIPGKREREERRGLGFPPRYSARNMFDGATHPRWSMHYLRNAHRMNAVNVAGPASRRFPPQVPPLLQVGRRIGSSRGTWEDLQIVRDVWDAPLLVKGITTSLDAGYVLESGADGIIVSNHGGRQLDGLPSTIDSLIEIADVINGRIPLLVDGGVRRGADIVKARALGAAAALIARPYHFGLALAGERGVVEVVDRYRTEFDACLALMGATSIRGISAANLWATGYPKRIPR